MGEFHARHPDFIRRHAVKHERVIGVGAMRHRYFPCLLLCATHIVQARVAEFSNAPRSPGAKSADYIECCSLRAAAAANMTFMTSANRNGASPKAKAFCQLPVAICSHAIPEANSRASATIPAKTFRAKEGVPRSANHPATKATTGYASK